MLAALTTWGPYPVSMVGMPGETSNMTPPTICLLDLAVAQVAMAMLVRDSAARWLERPTRWAAVVRFASMAMTVYLLPLSVTSGLVLAFFALFGLGFGPPNAGSGLWWLTRPLWLLGLMAALSGIATWLSPLERGRSTRPSTATHSVVAATGAGMGAALISFGLLGYVASGLQPAAHEQQHAAVRAGGPPAEHRLRPGGLGGVLPRSEISPLSLRSRRRSWAPGESAGPGPRASSNGAQAARNPSMSARVSTPIGLPPLMTRTASASSRI